MASPTYPSSHAALRGRVYARCLTQEGATHHWTNTNVQDALNRTQQEIQQILLLTFDEGWWTRTRSDLSASNRRIDLPADVIRVVGLDKKSGSDWVSVRPGVVPPARRHEYTYRTNFPKWTDETAPVHEVWVRYPGYIQYENSSNPSGTYRVHEQYRIKDLQEDDDVTEIPPEYQDVLVDGAAWRLARDAGLERTQILHADYAEGKFEMKRSAALRSLAARRRTRDVYGGGF